MQLARDVGGLHVLQLGEQLRGALAARGARQPDVAPVDDGDVPGAAEAARGAGGAQRDLRELPVPAAHRLDRDVEDHGLARVVEPVHGEVEQVVDDQRLGLAPLEAAGVDARR